MAPPAETPSLEALTAEARAHFKQCEEREAKHAEAAARLQQGVFAVTQQLRELAAERREETRRIYDRLDALGDAFRAQLNAERAERVASSELQRDRKDHRWQQLGWAVIGAAGAVIMFLVTQFWR